MIMFPLLRYTDYSAGYASHPGSTSLRERLEANATTAKGLLAAVEGLLVAKWRDARNFWNVLKLIRFSLLLVVVCVAVMLFNEQAQDALRALGEEPGWNTVFFVLAAVACAAVAWWDSRLMFCFCFENPASHPDEMPKIKEFLPHALGAVALGVPGIALIRASYAYEDWSDPVRCLWGVGVFLILLAAAFVWVTIVRHNSFARHEPRLASLTTLRQAPHVRPLAATAALCSVVMLLFAWYPVELAPWIGTPAIALLAVTGLIPVGSHLVWIGNRYQLPIVTPVLLWAVINSWLFLDNHHVRLHDEMETHSRSEQVPPELRAETLPPDIQSLERYIEKWLEGLQDEYTDQPVPVVLVAAEGGGIRAAYWTASVLGQLHDRATVDFARYTLAISGVSGGSLGAAAYAALVANRHAEYEPKPLEDCPSNESADATNVRWRAERMLDHDFLSPAVAVMLFPDLLQHLLPIHLIDDRAKALERSWQAAWDACEPGERFTQPLQNLWADGTPFATPLLFLNSTVVETGQRLIAAPVPIEPSRFSDALDSRETIGETVPLATAVHNSARFTYLSPAGLVKRQNVQHEQWFRVVDGGYFENSGAVTLSEILELVLEVAEERSFEITPVVIHISNDPETADPEQFDDPSLLAGQIRAPVRALLNTRPARGFQAREALHRRVLDLNESGDALRAYHFHFRLCRERRTPLPLGWTLSRAAEEEMRLQLGREASDNGPNAQRNLILRTALLAVLAGEHRDPHRLGNGFTCPSEKEQMRLAAGPDTSS
jgi:hypothetical protein